MEAVGFLISTTIFVGACIVIANWGRSSGLRWGQIWLTGIVLSPLIAALIVLIYSASVRIKSAFLEK